MTITALFNLIESSMGMEIEVVLLIAASMGGLIFFAKSMQFGIIFEFFISAICFMITYAWGKNYSYAAIIMFVWVVMMALSLYIVNKVSTNQGIL